SGPKPDAPKKRSDSCPPHCSWDSPNAFRLAETAAARRLDDDGIARPHIGPGRRTQQFHATIGAAYQCPTRLASAAAGQTERRHSVAVGEQRGGHRHPELDFPDHAVAAAPAASTAG